MSVKVLVRSLPIQRLEFAWGDDFMEAFRLVVHLLKPASAAAFLLALWRFGADLGWSSDFLVAEGLFSRWQIWLGLGFAMIGMQQTLEKRLETAPEYDSTAALRVRK